MTPTLGNSFVTFVRLVVVLVGAVTFSLTCGGVAAAVESVNTEYEIMDMIRMPSLHWIDDNQVLFAGIKRADIQAAIAAKQVDRGMRLKKLYVWDDVRKASRLYADASEVCFAEGLVSYPLRKEATEGKRIFREGKMGFETEVEKPLPQNEEFHSNFTCKTYKREELIPPAPRFRRVVVLKDGDGYLDFGPGGGKNLFEEQRAAVRNIDLYQATTGKAIRLPFTWDEDFSVFDVSYSVFRGAYVLKPRSPVGTPIGVSRDWPKDQPFPVYLVRPDGRVDSVSIPYEPAKHLFFPRPTRAGWIYGGGRNRDAGLYLFDGKAVNKIDVGLVKEIAVAPSGCKAAVAIQNNPFEMGTPTNLKIYQLCARER